MTGMATRLPGRARPANEEKAALTVAEVTLHLKRVLHQDDLLCDLHVRGELFNFKRHTSGHLYFTLKDAHSQLRCVMFRREAAGLQFEPADGARVVCHGSVDIYEAQGQYQLYVDHMRFDGVGALFERFEQLKRKLEAEGLFGRKRPLPAFPSTVGVITSPSGAAVRDIVTILRRRAPGTHILVFPAVVQGPEASISLVRSLRAAERWGGIEVLIVGRGGGSMEDLWAFNEERVARAAFACSLPIVSAVGHETDFTILDFVADLRAATPSAAAELVVPDVRELGRRLQQLDGRARRALHNRAELSRHRLRALLAARVLKDPQEILRPRRQQVDDCQERAHDAMREGLGRRRDSVDQCAATLVALDPRSVLRRGYAFFRTLDRSLIQSVAQVAAGQSAEVVLSDGRVTTRVEGVHGGT